MGVAKDIYDIFADVATKMEARRLQQREEMSRDDAVAYAASLETAVAELRTKVEQLEREHSAEVTDLKTLHAEEVSHLQAKIVALETQLQRPKRKSISPIRNMR